MINNRNKQLRFSVICCCYNSEKYILETLLSIKNQSYKNYEIIIVNDGSKDNTSNIINGVKKIMNINKNIKIITTNSKNNVIYAYNKKIKKIKPPKIKVKNENGAGDALAGMMLYLLSKGYSEDEILKYSVACGSYYASGKKLNSKKDLVKIKNISRKIIIK